ncbi:MAG: hypothetical protein JWO83_4222 [Caulobacteraceae bacterium]|jgi:hypothetical protein|nr:hypothetical protein [Caulobacteraceae bacterium]
MTRSVATTGAAASGEAPRRLTKRLLAPNDGARFRRMTLELDPDGGITLLSHEMGGTDQAPWGVDDEEITVRLDPEATSRLAFALLAEVLKGRSDAVPALLALAEAHGADAEVANWT